MGSAQGKKPAGGSSSRGRLETQVLQVFKQLASTYPQPILNELAKALLSALKQSIDSSSPSSSPRSSLQKTERLSLPIHPQRLAASVEFVLQSFSTDQFHYLIKRSGSSFFSELAKQVLDFSQPTPQLELDAQSRTSQSLDQQAQGRHSDAKQAAEAQRSERLIQRELVPISLASNQTTALEHFDLVFVPVPTQVEPGLSEVPTNLPVLTSIDPGLETFRLRRKKISEPQQKETAPKTPEEEPPKSFDSWLYSLELPSVEGRWAFVWDEPFHRELCWQCETLAGTFMDKEASEELLQALFPQRFERIRHMNHEYIYDGFVFVRRDPRFDKLEVLG